MHHTPRDTARRPLYSCSSSRTAPWTGLFRVVWLALPLMLSGCGLFGGGDSEPARRAVVPSAVPATPPMTIALDGRIDDWPTESAAVADRDYLYLRFKADRPTSLQSNGEALMVQLDVDADPLTGRRDGPLGIDLAITFSPPGDEGELKGGTRVEVISPEGEKSIVPAAALDIAFAPTHASEWFELRIGRRFAVEGLLPNRGLLGSGSVAGRIVLYSALGRPIAAADRFELELVPASGRPNRDAILVPERSLGSVRIVAFNVLNSSPDKTPEPFTRLLRALEPDVVLVQEWYDQTPESLAAWFNRELPIATSWQAVTSEGRGVAVVSRLDLQPLGPPAVVIRPEGEDRTVRVAAALVDSPAGPLAVASVHLKCCGSLGGREDLLRSAEASAITAMLREALADAGPHGLVIAGDYNLVGGTEPLAIMSEGMDLDGSELLVVEPFVLGDPAVYTWSDPRSAFLPGRLDYAAVSDSVLEVERAFVFDAERLDPIALEAMNLDPLDSRASDHRPLVIDVRSR
ncbi:MAG: endonuclease/exonuclease/phosphatase family protein [Phycisphaerales bacterium]